MIELAAGGDTTIGCARAAARVVAPVEREGLNEDGDGAGKSRDILCI